MATMRDPAWKLWYRGEHDRRCMEAGERFERYVTALLKRRHPDFINPEPMGRYGDGGCDGLADRGCILYACYGADPRRAIDTEERRKDDRTARKLTSDLERALEQWPDFTIWRFVTNASVGPMTTNRLNDLRNEHGPASARPLTLELWKEGELWFKAANLLTPDQLDEVLPGIPRSRDVELKDLVDLIALLEAGPSTRPTFRRPLLRSLTIKWITMGSLLRPGSSSTRAASRPYGSISGSTSRPRRTCGTPRPAASARSTSGPEKRAATRRRSSRRCIML